MFSPAADHHQLLHYHCPLPPLPSPLMEHKISSKPTVEVAPNCPRCASSSTKFCYFNNYSLSQPRYFCKACRRYWTKGGSLRNVPVGGGCRKTRRGKSLRSDCPASVSSSSQDSGDRSDTSNGDSADIDMASVFAKFLNQNPGSESGSESQSCYDPNQPAVAVGGGGGGGVLPDPDRRCYPEDQRIEDRQVVVENDDFGLDSLLGDHDRHRHEAVEMQDVFWSDHETWQLQELEAFPTNLISDNWSPLDLYSGFEVFSRS